MLFNSWTFLAFILPVLGLYHCLGRRRQNQVLLVASYTFYGAWDWRFLSLIWLSTLVDYVVGLRLARARDPVHKRRLLILSLLVNLGMLGFFKYCNFFVESGTDLLAALGWEFLAPRLDIVLPVGISFYTFQTLSYTLDVHRGRLQACRDPLDFALFVAFFPQLVAGPIERAAALLPQMQQPRRTSADQWVEGLWLILWGLFKKVVVADNLAVFVDAVFSGGELGFWRVLLGTYAFAYQIYGDFSGYSDIARGLAKLMGFELLLNFQQPYLATDPSDFWRRWHISLSTWLRDYLYIPLGGNRRGPGRTYLNLMLTMLLGGLWHGARWNFVLWGAYHGGLLALHRRFFHGRSRWPRWLRQLGMFHLTCLGWLFFRATSLAQIRQLLGAFASNFSVDAATLRFLPQLLLLPALLWSVEAWVRNRDDPRESPGWNRGLGPLVVALLLLACFVLAPAGERSFIYFQF